MADTELNIVLNATGGTEAANQVNMARASIDSMTRSSSAMESQFQRRFQHIGLMLFAGDALRASGLGRETRMVIQTLNIALTEGAAVAGISSGGFLLIVTALGALAGIAAKVISHHKDLVDTLTKSTDASLKAADATQKEVDKITHYVEIGGRLTKLEKEEYDAKKALALAEEASAEITMSLAIPALNQHIVRLQEDRANLVQNAISTATLGEVMIKSHIPALMLGGKLLLSHATDTDILRQKQAALTVEINKQIATLKTYERTLVDIRAGNKLTWDEKIKQIEDENHKSEAAAKKEHEAYKKMWQLRIADARAATKEFEKEQTQVTKMASLGAKTIADAFGQSFAAAVFAGQDFTAKLAESFTKLAEHFVQAVITMIIEWLALKAVMSIIPGGAAATQAAALPMYLKDLQAANSLIQAHMAGRMAFGGTVVANQPTVAIFGEAGPEMATFTPLSGGVTASTSVGTGTSINIGNVVTNVSGVNNPDEIARIVGQKIVQQIRGQGQINFARA